MFPQFFRATILLSCAHFETGSTSEGPGEISDLICPDLSAELISPHATAQVSAVFGTVVCFFSLSKKKKSRFGILTSGPVISL